MLSIAMTTYNGEKYLREQLDSILNQTYSDFELIICDDCSKDNTRQILSEYAAKDSRIKIFFNEENLGFKKNFEKAISLCSGEYIALSDQDDIWLENHLDVLVNNIGNCDIACGDAELIDSNGKKLNLKLSDTDGLQFIPDDDNVLYRILCHSGCFQGASMLIKKTLLTKALPIPEDVFFHDAWFSACACCNNKINYTYETITQYRQHTTQITSHKKETYLRKICRFLSIILKKESYKSDRLDYINNLRQRFHLSPNISDILNNSEKIQLLKAKKLSFRKKIKTLKLYRKLYNDIYTQKSNKYKFSRTLKFLF